MDRMSLSAKNRWFNDAGKVYIIFTVEEIMETLNCRSQKAVKLLAELDVDKGIGLIEKKSLGLGKANIIYAKNILTAVDTWGFESNKHTKEAQTFEHQNSGRVKSITKEFRKSKGNNTDLSNINL